MLNNPLNSPDGAHNPHTLSLYLGVWTMSGELKGEKCFLVYNKILQTFLTIKRNNRIIYIFYHI